MKVYLDYHSSTPLDDRVAEAMKPFFSERFGNPAAEHALGIDAAEAVEEAREQVAALIGAQPEHVYFTNSATESNNIMLQGFWNRWNKEKICIITTETEHSSIMKCVDCAPDYVKVVNIKINKDGTLNYGLLKDHIEYSSFNHLTLVSIIAANNEIGTIHDIEKISKICEEADVLFHTDATQAIGKIDIDVEKMNISALTMSGHKIYGPKGVGILYLENSSLIKPMLHGGYQNTITSGTQNVPAIVGMGKACEILKSEAKTENKRIKKLRNKFWNILNKNLSGIFINGTIGKNRLPNNLNITIEGIKAEALIKGMDDVIISGGSACTSGNIEPSHVILALRTPHPEGAVRLSLGRWTTDEEINYAAERIISVVQMLRGE